jgi:hypothetical protein
VFPVIVEGFLGVIVVDIASRALRSRRLFRSALVSPKGSVALTSSTSALVLLNRRSLPIRRGRQERLTGRNHLRRRWVKSDSQSEADRKAVSSKRNLGIPHRFLPESGSFNNPISGQAAGLRAVDRAAAHPSEVCGKSGRHPRIWIND